MSDIRLHESAERTPIESDSPPFAEDALVVVLGHGESIHKVVRGYIDKNLVTSGLGSLLEYLDVHREGGARLTPLYPERSLRVIGPEAADANWRVALPDHESNRTALSAYHYVDLTPNRNKANAEGNAQLEAALRADPNVLLVYHPAIPYIKDPPAELEDSGARAHGFVQLGDTPQWGLEFCGFPEAWACLDQGSDPGPIGVIDKGGDLGHQELTGKITEFPPHLPPLGAAHASAVMGILSAHRDGQGMDGCCSAHVHLYNIFTDKGLDPKAFILALKSVACEGLRVVNISLQMRYDRLVEEQIRECIEQGVIIVAAMGNDGDRVKVFPAGYPGVIAVGAVNKSGTKLKASNIGDHIWISAPGSFIYTIRDSQGIDEDHHGTSYATAHITAAAWLALRARPHWNREQIRDLLARSVFGNGKHSRQLGYGILDLRKMIQELNCGRPDPCHL